MRQILIAAIAAAAMSTAASAADVEAKFLGAKTYSSAKGCEKLKALANGAPRNITNVPEVLTAKGYLGWEGGCAIERVQEQVKAKRWLVSLRCDEGAVTDQRHQETWEKAPDGAILISFKKKRERYVACPVVPKAAN